MKTEYKEGQMTLGEAKKLAVKILSKTLDATKLTADKGIIYGKIKKKILLSVIQSNTNIIFSRIRTKFLNSFILSINT